MFRSIHNRDNSTNSTGIKTILTHIIIRTDVITGITYSITYLTVLTIINNPMILILTTLSTLILTILINTLIILIILITIGISINNLILQ